MSPGGRPRGMLTENHQPYVAYGSRIYSGYGGVDSHAPAELARLPISAPMRVFMSHAGDRHQVNLKYLKQTT